MRIRPLHDQVVVECEPLKEELYQGLLHLPHQQRVRHGRVIAVGPGYESYKNGKRTPLSVKIGQRVAFFRENMETLNGKQIANVLYEMSTELGKDIALLPESALFGEIDENTTVTA